MLHSVRRGVALVAVPALALAALAATPGTASAAPGNTDLNPGTAAAGWLAQQPVNGIVSYKSFGFVNPDPGLSIDVGFALQLLGSQETTVTEIGNGIAASVQQEGGYSDDYSYEAPEDYTDPDSPMHTYAGRSSNATAKALAFLKATGGHEDVAESLTSKLVNDLVEDGPGEGRLTDYPMRDGNDYPAGDYANILGQAFAVRALDAVSHPATTPATDYLLGLQCADGSFKEALPATAAATPDCAAAAGAGSIDATATAVVSLSSQADDTAVQAAITKAAAWLVAQQQADGSFSTGADFGANSNSTGLATTALGLTGAAASATKGAVWVRQHQVHYQDACAPFAPSASGAIAYDGADRAAGLKDGITEDTYGTWLRASAQAATALLWAPKGDGANVLFTAEYVKAGGTKAVGVIGADPGEQLCAAAGSTKVVGWADANGEADLQVAIPSKTATTKVAVYDVETKLGTATIKALGAKKLPIKLKAKVRKGKTQTVKVTGLAPGESVKVKLLGKTRSGQANKNGVFTASAKATGKYGKPGRAKVTVVGEFANRKGSKTFKVVR